MDKTNNINNIVELEPCFKWSTNATKLFLDIYQTKRKHVGSAKIRTFKTMWEQISQELKDLNINVEAHHCENRWRVLERAYKKFLENKGVGKGYYRTFDFEEQMEQILGKKIKTNPTLILDSTVKHLPKIDIELTDATENNIKNKKPPVEFTNNIKKPKTILELIKEDRSMYYKQRIEIEREKLRILKIKNELIKERNMILRQKFSQNNTKTSLN